MNCSQVLELISAYVDGMLDGRVRQAVDAHLRGCPDCRRELGCLSALIAAAGRVEPADPPSYLKNRILQSVGELRAKSTQCEEARGLFSAYVDDEVSAGQRALVENHVAACEDCAGEVEMLRVLVYEAGQVAGVEPPAGLRQRIAALTTQRRSARLAAIRWLHGLVTVRTGQWAAGAAAAGVIAVGFVMNLPQAPKEALGVRVAQASRPGHAAQVTVVPEPSPTGSSQAVTTSQPTVLQSRAHFRLAQPGIAGGVPRNSARPTRLPAVPEVEVPRTEETVVAQVPEPQPEEKVETAPAPVAPPPAKEIAPVPEKDPLVQVALVPPAVSSDNREWIRQIKTQAGMHLPQSGKTGVRASNTRF